MPPMAHQQYFLALAVVLLSFIVYPCHQRADRVDNPEAAFFGLLEVIRRRAVGGEHHQRSDRDLVQGINRDGPFSFQVGDDVGIMDDLVFHVDRRAVPLQANIYNLYGAHHPGAKAAR